MELNTTPAMLNAPNDFWGHLAPGICLLRESETGRDYFRFWLLEAGEVDPLPASSLVAGVVVSLASQPPDERLVSKLFDANHA